MTRTRVKVCGLTRAQDAALAVELGADAVGFVLWSRSPRAVDPDRASAIARAVPAFVARVGVFVNASPTDVRQTASTVGLDAVQLHGDESVADFAGAAPSVIKAVTVETEADVEAASALPPEVTVLVDAADCERRGGTGARANWAHAAELARRRPVILAGGLTAETVQEAIDRVHPWAIDVSSGVEERPGVKSADKLRAFFAALRREQP